MNLGSSLQTKLANLPRAPGVYLLLDARSRVLYVGKARNLRQRVRSYFTAQSSDERVLLPFLRTQITDLDVIQVATEKEAFLLENNLIKRHKPKYNVRLIDDKTFLSLRLATGHPFPRFTTVRRRREDGARYFGPYSSARSIRHTLKLIYRAFGIRNCSDAVLANRTRPCLYYQIGQCLAPCVDYVTRDDYAAALHRATLFLSGRSDELLSQLRSDMSSQAENEDFERAARTRDTIRAVERTLERQDVSVGRDVDFDVIGHARSPSQHAFVWLEVRDGRVLGSSTTRVRDPATAEFKRLLSTVLALVYEDKPLPAKVIVPVEPKDQNLLEQVLSDRRGARVEVRTATRGFQKRLLSIATANAENALALQEKQGDQNANLLDGLATLLDLPKRPRRIECFDLSNLGGTLAVGSMVVALDGVMVPAHYRHYRLRDAAGNDDYAGMREVLTRRLTRALDDGILPDLLIVDGGRGQLSIARSVMEEIGIVDVPLIGLAKGADRNAGQESIHRTATTPIWPAHNDPRLHLLQRIRDEAHRFAITYNRQLRGTRDRTLSLDSVPGMGPKRIKRLLQTFGSIEGIRQASVAQLAHVPGMNATVAARVHATLQAKSAPPSANERVEIPT